MKINQQKINEGIKLNKEKKINTIDVRESNYRISKGDIEIITKAEKGEWIIDIRKLTDELIYKCHADYVRRRNIANRAKKRNNKKVENKFEKNN